MRENDGSVGDGDDDVGDDNDDDDDGGAEWLHLLNTTRSWQSCCGAAHDLSHDEDKDDEDDDDNDIEVILCVSGRFGQFLLSPDGVPGSYIVTRCIIRGCQ